MAAITSTPLVVLMMMFASCGARTAVDAPTSQNTMPLSDAAVDGSASAVIAIAAGENTTCAIVSAALECWGANHEGEIGNADQTNALLPEVVNGILPSVVALGTKHVCALSSGSVFCWGLNVSGQLGTGDYVTRFLPTSLADLTGVTMLAMGGEHSCILRNDGHVFCWGNNADDQVAHTAPQAVTTPVDVGLTDVVSVGAGSKHTCAVLIDGTVVCWGANSTAQLGSADLSAAGPFVVAGVSGAVQVVAGASHTCALTQDGAVWCWGANDLQQLGTTTTECPTQQFKCSSMPIQVNLKQITKLAAGSWHTCAIDVEGTLSCWGNNANGQLGDGTPNTSASPVVSVQHATAIACGESHTCAVVSAHKVYCWGLNYFGQLGTGTTLGSEWPTEVATL